jgi:hypothetical protein
VDRKRSDRLNAALSDPASTRRKLLRRAGVGGLATLLAALGLLDVSSPDVAARKRRKRRRRGGGTGAGSGGGGGSGGTTY